MHCAAGARWRILGVTRRRESGLEASIAGGVMRPAASPSSRGLGSSPFKAETRVRIPLGTPPRFRIPIETRPLPVDRVHGGARRILAWRCGCRARASHFAHAGVGGAHPRCGPGRPSDSRGSCCERAARRTAERAARPTVGIPCGSCYSGFRTRREGREERRGDQATVLRRNAQETAADDPGGVDRRRRRNRARRALRQDGCPDRTSGRTPAQSGRAVRPTRRQGRHAHRRVRETRRRRPLTSRLVPRPAGPPAADPAAPGRRFLPDRLRNGPRAREDAGLPAELAVFVGSPAELLAAASPRAPARGSRAPPRSAIARVGRWRPGGVSKMMMDRSFPACKRERREAEHDDAVARRERSSGRRCAQAAGGGA